MRLKQSILLFSVLIGLVSCQQEDHTDLLMGLVKEVQKEYRPDKRVSIFDVNIEKVDAIYVAKGKSTDAKAKKALFQKFEASGVIVGNKIQLLPDNKLGENKYGIVNVSVCNMRSNSKHSAELGTQALLGMTLNILFEKEGWYRVQNRVDGYLGWLDAGGFQTVTIKELKNYMKADKIIYTSEYGFVFNAQNETHLSDITAGGILEYINETKDYYTVVMPDGRQGRVLKSEAKKTTEWRASSTLDGDSFVETAERFMGTPYVWGGTSPKGMDCSGFTKTAAYLNGVILARDASQQVHQGVEVKTDTTLVNLIKGDLLFFGRHATAEKKERISHVAIYMGDGKVIHSTGRVKIESLKRGDTDFNEERLNTFIRAKRIVGDDSLNKVVL